MALNATLDCIGLYVTFGTFVMILQVPAKSV